MSLLPVPLYCEVFGHKLAYHTHGTGRPVLLVHGITTYSFIWRKIMVRMGDKYQVIAVDLLGCGDSDKPLNVEYSIKHHAKLLKEFMARIGIEKCHYVGHDVGGGIGQILAVRYPDVLYDLTLINTVAYDLWPVQPISAIRTPIIRQLLTASLNLGIFEMIVKRGLYHKERMTAELMDYFWRPMKSTAGRKSFVHFANCLDNKHLLEIAHDLGRMNLPVLIIRGNADPYLSQEISGRLHAEIRDSQLFRIKTGGHFIQEDEPDEVVEILKRFLG